MALYRLAGAASPAQAPRVAGAALRVTDAARWAADVREPPAVPREEPGAEGHQPVLAEVRLPVLASPVKPEPGEEQARVPPTAPAPPRPPDRARRGAAERLPPQEVKLWLTVSSVQSSAPVRLGPGGKTAS